MDNFDIFKTLRHGDVIQKNFLTLIEKIIFNNFFFYFEPKNETARNWVTNAKKRKNAKTMIHKI